MIERAVISSSGDRLRLHIAAPDISQQPAPATQRPVTESSEFVTATEFKQLEKVNIEKALQHAGGKTWGPDGAAELLGMKPSTLAYQMKKLGIISR